MIRNIIKTVIVFLALTTVVQSQNMINPQLNGRVEFGLKILFISQSQNAHAYSTHHFVYKYSEPFLQIPTGMCSIVGFQGSQSQNETTVKVQLEQVRREDMLVLATSSPSITLIKMSFLIIEIQFYQKQGLYWWSPSQQNQFNGHNLIYHSQQQKINKIQKIQMIQNTTQIIVSNTQISIPRYHSSGVQIIDITVFLNEVTLIKTELQNKQQKIASKITPMGIQVVFVDPNNLFRSSLPLYTLVIKMTTDFSEYITKFILEQNIFEPQKFNKFSLSSNKIMMFGLNSYSLQPECTSVLIHFTIQTVQQVLSFKKLPNKHFKTNLICQTQLRYSILSIFQPNSLQSITSINRLLVPTSCPLAQNLSYYAYNWTGIPFFSYSTYVTSTTLSCQPCPVGCLSCIACSYCEGYTSCTACMTNNSFTLSSWQNNNKITYYCSCPQNLSASAVTNTCQSCSSTILNCASCKMSHFFTASCSTCNSGFFRTNNNRVCTPCPAGCAVCNSTVVCSTCFPGFTKSASVCTCDATKNLFYSSVTNTCTTCAIAIINCTTCVLNGTTTSCQACALGTYLINNTCLPCTTYCTNCTATTCNKCPATFVISGTTCICNATLQLFLSNGSCVSCSTLISNCSNCTFNGTLQCTTCIAGNFFNGLTCLTCGLLCTTCNSSSTCAVCFPTFVSINGTCACNQTDGFYLNAPTNQCLQCSNIISDCSTCFYNTTGSVMQCTSCITGLFIQNGTCTSCPLTCLNCTNLTVCGACAAGYFLNGTSFNCQCINCSSCIAIPGCVDCVSSNCTLCAPGYFLSGTNCTVCPTGCATCNSATDCPLCALPFISSVPSGSCQCNNYTGFYYNPVNQTCSTCSSIISQCTSCSSLNYTTSCLDCLTGFYLFNNTCTTCPNNCTACNSAVDCLSCSLTFTIINGTCACDESNQIFLNSTSSQCQSCVSLITSCISCSNVGSNLTCTTCLSGLFVNSTTFLCDNCPIYCLTCINSTFCDSCQNSFQLINNMCACNQMSQIFLLGSICTPCYNFVSYCLNCTNNGSSVICIQCSAGTYMSANNLSCLQCPDNCAACSSTGCTTCNNGYNNNVGVCECLTTCQAFTGSPTHCNDCIMVNTTNNVTGNITSTIQCMACAETTYNVDNTSCQTCPTTCLTCSNYLNCQLCIPSYTLINGQCQCNSYANQFESGGVCRECSFLIPFCFNCDNSVSLICTICYPTYYLANSTTCLPCNSGCLTCYANLTCIQCIDSYYLTGTTCSMNGTSCDFTLGVFGPSNLSCTACATHCQNCISLSLCLVCLPSFRLNQGICICDNGLGQFYNANNGLCQSCKILGGALYSLYLQNCSICHEVAISLNYSLTLVECLTCDNGFYVNIGSCNPCPTGCNKCTSGTSCCSCQGPAYKMNFSTCVCDTLANYFPDNSSICHICILSNCSICATLYDCANCTTGFYINTSSLQCIPQVCGNGIIEGLQVCDDNNTINLDGCTSTCLQQNFFLCTGSPSICFYDNRFNIKLHQISAACNSITYDFMIYPYDSAYAGCDFSHFLSSSNQTFSTLTNIQVKSDIISYTYAINDSIQNLYFEFVFDPQTLCTPIAASLPPKNVILQVLPSNNINAYFYEADICTTQQSMQKITQALQYTTYGVLMLSALPCKIVGLQLIGVLQLAFFSLGSMDNVNVMMAPMLKMKAINGFTLDLGNDPSPTRLLQTTTLTPERINALGYSSNFLRNCNVMFLLVVTIIIVSFVLYLLTFFFKNCAPTIHRISKRMIKQVLLTLILFNCFNFAYSVGIHFNYASTSDSLYMLGTLAALATLIIPIIMAIGLMASEQDGFGQYKDKLKDGCVEKGYFVVTIAYRMAIGIYMSTSNQNQLSTLIILALSLLFLLYNLVNLPFRKAYHNYRANICHLTQFICLFVTMYYRSMKSTSPSTSVAHIYSPVYLQYACIAISIIISLIVLIYDSYLWLRQCCGYEQSIKIEQHSANQANQVNQIEVHQSQANIEDTKQAEMGYDDFNIYD